MDSPGPAGVPANIFVTELLGGDMLVEVEFGEDRIQIKTKPDFRGAMGEQRRIQFHSDRWHAFARTDGRAYF